MELLRFLLNAWTLATGGNLKWIVNESRYTALEIAAQSNDVGVIRLLLEYGADDASLALRKALWVGDVDMEVVELLLASGAQVGILHGDYEGTSTALELAAWTSRSSVLRLLPEHRNDRIATHEKSRALQTAAYEGNLDAAELLLDHGAEINAAPLLSFFEDRYDFCLFRTALQAAAGKGDLKLVRFLLDCGADVESKVPSENGQGTALQFAAIAGSMSVVTELIQKGADVSAPAIDYDGRTALEGAAEHGRLDVVQLLLDLGVESAGSRAIQFAREEGHEGVIALLQEAGWDDSV